MKRYGVLFTCLASRAIHLETSTSLETDAFINALRRFICRRGPIRQLRSDQGTNFVGAKHELKAALAELDHERIKAELLKKNCDWFAFAMNVPSSSHMGGVWERQIRTVKSVLFPLLQNNGLQLDDELRSSDHFSCVCVESSLKWWENGKVGIGSYLEDQRKTGSSCRRLHPYHLKRSSRILMVVGNSVCSQQTTTTL